VLERYEYEKSNKKGGDRKMKNLAERIVDVWEKHPYKDPIEGVKKAIERTQLAIKQIKTTCKELKGQVKEAMTNEAVTKQSLEHDTRNR
jgi:archaellum component FlaC